MVDDLVVANDFDLVGESVLQFEQLNKEDKYDELDQSHFSGSSRKKGIQIVNYTRGEDAALVRAW